MHNLTSNKLSILTQMWSMDKTKTIIFANWIQINLFHLFPMQEPPCKKKRVKNRFGQKTSKTLESVYQLKPWQWIQKLYQLYKSITTKFPCIIHFGDKNQYYLALMKHLIHKKHASKLCSMFSQWESKNRACMRRFWHLLQWRLASSVK